MSEKRDYYEVLGISRSADSAAIKKHIGNWRKNITRITMQEIRQQKKSLRRSQKHMMS